MGWVFLRLRKYMRETEMRGLDQIILIASVTNNTKNMKEPKKDESWGLEQIEIARS